MPKRETKSVAGDRTADYCFVLYKQGESMKTIAKRLELSGQKVRRILVTEGLYYTDEAKLFEDGYSVDEICQRTGKKRSAVIGRLPYTKGMYDAEKPTANAKRIRKHREK